MIEWTAILPVARWDLAKTRLHVRPDVRRSIARAFSLDVLEVMSEAPSVGHIILVTAELELRSLGSRMGATAVHDRGLRSTDSLNDAIRLGRAWALSHRPEDRAVVVPSDLPSLTIASFEQALSALGRVDRALIPDEAGTGTTLLAARSPSGLQPLYGSGSARRHRLNGIRRVVDVDPRVRRDVDTLGDLAAACALGVGPYTERTLDAIGITLERQRADHAV